MNWDNLIRAIQEQACIILLGPAFFEMNVAGKIQPLHPFLMKELEKNYPKQLEYFESDELFLLEASKLKGDCYYTLKGFLEDEQNVIEGEMLQKLSAIPLHLLLTFTPYLNPKEVFPKLGIPHPFEFVYYSMNRGFFQEESERANCRSARFL